MLGSFKNFLILFIIYNLLLVSLYANQELENDTPLHSAARINDVDKIAQIIRNDGKREFLNEIGYGGQTPLMAAVLSGSTEAVKLLLDNGADPNIAEQDGYTPMHGYF